MGGDLPQLDEVLSLAGIPKESIVSVRWYLQDIVRDIAAIKAYYKQYFG